MKNNHAGFRTHVQAWPLVLGCISRSIYSLVDIQTLEVSKTNTTLASIYPVVREQCCRGIQHGAAGWCQPCSSWRARQTVLSPVGQLRPPASCSALRRLLSPVVPSDSCWPSHFLLKCLPLYVLFFFNIFLQVSSTVSRPKLYAGPFHHHCRRKR